MVDELERQRVAGIYTRISHDDSHERIGVQGQAEDGRRELERRRVALHRVYEDDDVTGSGEKYRDDFEELLDDLRSGVIDTVWAWDVDRLFRGLREFVDFVELCERRQALVLWLTGEADFATGHGIDELEFRAMFARMELRKMKQRARRRQQRDAQVGQWHGGGSAAYGYERTTEGLQIVEAEAKVIREAADRVLNGEPLEAVSRDLNRRGITTKQGRRWHGSLLRNLLTRASISGRREHHGEVAGKGEWGAIISPADSDRLRELLLDPARDRRGRLDSHLLSGLLYCGRCGTRLVCESRRAGTSNGKGRATPARRRYICRSSGEHFHGCGQTAISADRVENVVKERLFDLDDGRLRRILQGEQRGEAEAAERELTEVRKRLRELGREVGRARARGDSVTFLEGEREALEEREQQAVNQLSRGRRRLNLPNLAGGLREAWEKMSVAERRTVIRAALGEPRITVRPPTGHGWDPERVLTPWLE